MLAPWNKYVSLIEWALRQIYEFTGNFGLAIIIFTIVLKTLMVPLTVKSIRSTMATQELQPKIKELQKKFGKDRAKLQQETMKLYQEYDINPLAGCLPMLLQFPIFLGLYLGIKGLSHNVGGFLWMDDLSQPDPYKILPIAAGVFQFIQTKMMRPHNAPKVTDPQQQMMQTMMSFMPLMVVVFGWTFAAGPVIYWVTQSIYSVVQQWFITGWGTVKDWAPFLPELPEHRRLGHRKQPLTRVEGDVKPKGLFARMQAQMLEQQTQPAGRGGATTERQTDAAPRATAEPAAGKRARRARGAGAGAGAGTSANDSTISGGAQDDDTVSAPKTTPRRTRGAGASAGANGNAATNNGVDTPPRRRK